jgi:hypothetical protein
MAIRGVRPFTVPILYLTLMSIHAAPTATVALSKDTPPPPCIMMNNDYRLISYQVILCKQCSKFPEVFMMYVNVRCYALNVHACAAIDVRIDGFWVQSADKLSIYADLDLVFEFCFVVVGQVYHGTLKVRVPRVY